MAWEPAQYPDDWTGGWRCINCGELIDKTVFINLVVSRCRGLNRELVKGGKQ
jgi:hypothetical protein